MDAGVIYKQKRTFYQEFGDNKNIAWPFAYYLNK